MLTSPGPIGVIAAHPSSWARMLRWVSMAPLGWPVVPEVYSTRQGSSGAASAASSGSAVAMNSSHCPVGMVRPAKSISSLVSSTTGRQSPRMLVIWPGASRRLSITVAAPSEDAANVSSIVARWLVSSTATRSPRPTPASRSAPAALRIRSRQAAQVYVRSSKVIAVSSGRTLAQWSIGSRSSMLLIVPLPVRSEKTLMSLT
jgi:hypothetical protein